MPEHRQATPRGGPGASTLFDALYADVPPTGGWAGAVDAPPVVPVTRGAPKTPRLPPTSPRDSNGTASRAPVHSPRPPRGATPRSPRRPAALLNTGEPQPLQRQRRHVVAAQRREVSYLTETKGHGILARSSGELDFVLPPSGVPEVSALYSQSPLPPAATLGADSSAAAVGAAAAAKSGLSSFGATRGGAEKPLLWQNRVFPNRVPASRQDSLLLSQWLHDHGPVLRNALEAINALSHHARAQAPPRDGESDATPQEFLQDAERLKMESERLGFTAERAVLAARDAVDVYNRAAKELIREVSVHCVERGALLADVWNGAMTVTTRLSQRLGDLVGIQGDVTSSAVSILAKEQNRILEERIEKALEVSRLEAELEQGKPSNGRASVGGRGRRRGSVHAEEILAQLGSPNADDDPIEENLKLRGALEDAKIEMARMEVELDRQVRNEESRQVLEQRIRHLEQDLDRLTEHQRSLTPRPDRYLGPSGKQMSTAMLDALLRLATEAAPFLAARAITETKLAKLLLGEPVDPQRAGWSLEELALLGALRDKVEDPMSGLKREDILRSLQKEEMTMLIGHADKEVLEFIQVALQRGIDHESIVEFVTGKTQEGLPITPGCYGVFFNSDIGVKELAEMITYATVPTRRRFELMEKQIEHLHEESKRAKPLESSLKVRKVDIEEKKDEDEDDDAARKRNKKQSPLERFLSKQWKDTFVGMGTGADVPKFMRTNGKIRNRNMSKRDTEKLVKEIWSDKMRHDAKQARPTSLDEFTGIFLQKKMGIQSAVVEIGYNFIHALQKHAYDADCELFLKILQGEIREEVYSAQIRMCNNVSLLCEALDSLSHGDKVTGFVSLADLRVGLRALFPKKTSERHAELMEALSEDQPGSQIEHGRLFEEDREYNQGPFAEALRDQWLEERLEHLESIESELEKAQSTMGDKELDMVTVSLALRETDPGMSDGARRKMAEEATRGGATTVAAIMRNLRKGAMDSDGDDEADVDRQSGSGGVSKAGGLFKAAAKLKLASAGSGGASKLANVANFVAKSTNRMPKAVQNAVETVRETWIERETAVKTPRKARSKGGSSEGAEEDAESAGADPDAPTD